jgi:hypothetical protein
LLNQFQGKSDVGIGDRYRFNSVHLQAVLPVGRARKGASADMRHAARPRKSFFEDRFLLRRAPNTKFDTIDRNRRLAST